MRKRITFEVELPKHSTGEITMVKAQTQIAEDGHWIPLYPVDNTLTITNVTQGEAHGWLPIATAQKDGRHILLAIKTPVGEIFVGCWSTHFEQWFTVSESGGGVISHRHKPTHWMSLPALPEVAPEAAKDEKA